MIRSSSYLTTDLTVIVDLNNFEFFGLRKQIILKKLKLPPNFVDFKQTINTFFAMSIEGNLQQKTRDFLEQANFATSNE